MTYFVFFLAILVGSLTISYWSAQQGMSKAQFYLMSRKLTGGQNGLAIAGDFISAASFLGVTGAISMQGVEGMLYSAGFFISYSLLLLVAEPIHNLGVYTFADVIAARFSNHSIRGLLSCSTIVVSLLYMIPQILAAGLLIQLLLGIDYSISVAVIGLLMTMYVVFGGMVAASWVQIIKTILLVSGTFLLMLLVLSKAEWSLPELIHTVQQKSPLGKQFFEFHTVANNPLETLSLNLTLILGTSGLPHILIRFFTVKNVAAVKRSIYSAAGILGVFYLMVIILGMGAVAFIPANLLQNMDASGDLAAPFLAYALGGDFFMAFITAIAFSTILAVVTGLLLSATSSFAHDIYSHLLRHEETTEKQQLNITRIAAAVIGLIAVLLSVTMKNLNVLSLVSLTFAVAASAHLPVLLLTLYWKRFTSTGVIVGILTGLISSLAFVIVGPDNLFLHGGWLAKHHIFPLHNPGIVTIPLGFASAIIGSFLSRKPSEREDQRFLRLCDRRGAMTTLSDREEASHG